MFSRRSCRRRPRPRPRPCPQPCVRPCVRAAAAAAPIAAPARAHASRRCWCPDKTPTCPGAQVAGAGPDDGCLACAACKQLLAFPCELQPCRHSVCGKCLPICIDAGCPSCNIAIDDGRSCDVLDAALCRLVDALPASDALFRTQTQRAWWIAREDGERAWLNMCAEDREHAATETDGDGDDADYADDQAEEMELSAYERQRLANMRSNRAQLVTLGLDGFELAPRRAPDAAEKAAGAKARQERLAEALQNRRKSGRIVPKATDDRELRRLRYDRARRESEAELTRRRGARPATSMAALTEAERAALECATDEWIGGFREYFAATLSETNLRSVMRVVERLASGQGVDAGGLRTATPVFCKGQPVSK